MFRRGRARVNYILGVLSPIAHEAHLWCGGGAHERRRPQSPERAWAELRLMRQSPPENAMSQAAARAVLDPNIADAELARRVAAGEEPALRLLMRRHNQTLFRTARAILRDDAEAEDVVQEAYLKAIRGIGGFRDDARLATWLVRIVVNEALTRLRRVKRSAQVIPLAGDLPDGMEVPDPMDESSDNPETEALRAETRRIMESRIDALPETYRTVFVLRAIEELSVEDTAAALGIPEATVRTRFFRARGLLRESLSRAFDLALDQAFHFAGERCDRIIERVLARLADGSTRKLP
jgi:RNA polymerase sigma-70 factor, ECF subfamily